MSPNQHHLLCQLTRKADLTALNARTATAWASRAADDAQQMTALVTALVATLDGFPNVELATRTDTNPTE